MWKHIAHMYRVSIQTSKVRCCKKKYQESIFLNTNYQAIDVSAFDKLINGNMLQSRIIPIPTLKPVRAAVAGRRWPSRPKHLFLVDSVRRLST